MVAEYDGSLAENFGSPWYVDPAIERLLLRVSTLLDISGVHSFFSWVFQLYYVKER